MRAKLFTRNSNNPILTAKDWPYEVHSVFNAAVTQGKDEIILLARCEDYQGISHLTVARSRNGVDGWKIDSSPTLLPEPEEFKEELWGIEDPRITYIEEEKKWSIVYTSFQQKAPWFLWRKQKILKILKNGARFSCRIIKMQHYFPAASMGSGL